MANPSESQSGGVGFLGLLTLLFIGLKLAGVIGWSWFYVLSPMLAPLILVATFLVVVLPFVAIAKLVGR